MSSPRSPREPVRLGLLLAAAALLWLTQGGFWNADSWRYPASYNVDALETLTRFHLSAGKGLQIVTDPVVDSLGAPWSADWSAYLMPDAPWYWLVGWLVRWFGLMPASHAAIGLGHLAAVAAFYLCARLLRHRPLPAAGAALLFGFSHYILYRGLSHHSFTLGFFVPPGLLAAGLIARSRRVLQTLRWRLFCLAVAAAVGTGNPYFVFMQLQLLGFALLWQLLTARRRPNLRTGMGCLLLCSGVFLAVNFPALRAAATGEGTHAFKRSAADANFYALRPVELAMPTPRHHWPAAASLGRAYEAATGPVGEIFSSYLGSVGVIGLGLVLLGGLRRTLRRGAAKFRPGPGTVAVWILAFSATGGVNTWLAQAGLDVFRAGNRYSIYLLVPALLALSASATRRWGNRPRFAAGICVVAVTTFGLWDQFPAPLAAFIPREIRSMVQDDQRTARVLQATLPAGAMIFQLPAVPFPEAGPRGGMSDYEHLRPYLHTSHLRYSYGAMRATARERWQERTAELPAAALVERLRAAGFRAIWVDRRAYNDNGGFLVASLGAAGAREISLPDSRHVALFEIMGDPVATRLPDLTEVRWDDAWEPGAAGQMVSMHATRGWFGLETAEGRPWRWAGHSAELGLWNGSAEPRQVRLHFLAGSLAAGALEVSRGGHLQVKLDLNVRLKDSPPVDLTLPPGSTRLEWEFSGPLIKPAGESRRLGFKIEQMRLEIR